MKTRERGETINVMSKAMVHRRQVIVPWKREGVGAGGVRTAGREQVADITGGAAGGRRGLAAEVASMQTSRRGAFQGGARTSAKALGQQCACRERGPERPG